MSTIPGIGNNISTELQTKSSSRTASDTQTKQSATQETKVNTVSDDSVQLSKASQLVNDIEKELKNYPAVNESRVAELKQKIASGEYYPDSQKIAGQMLMLEGAMEKKNDQ